MPPALLCLEITESGFMEDPAHAQKVLDRLSELGVKLSIDDYGTGYSSLSYIMRLPVQELKIDHPSSRAWRRDDEISTIVRSTIDLGPQPRAQGGRRGRRRRWSVWNMLRTLGCDDAQGFFMSRPLDRAHARDAGFAPTTERGLGLRRRRRQAPRDATASVSQNVRRPRYSR